MRLLIVTFSPKTVVDVLYHIHALEANEGYGQKLWRVPGEKGSARITVVANQSGTARSLAVAEKQVRIQGLYDFTVSPEKAEKVKTQLAGLLHSLIPSRTINLYSVISTILLWHNQQVDSRFIPQIDSVLSHADYDKKSKSFSNTGLPTTILKAQNQLDIQTMVRGVVTIPE